MAKTDKKRPWFSFYPSDWRGDAKLRMCSIGARGLWAEMLCIMHEAEPYGHLLNNGHTVTNRQMAALAGISQAECMKFMCELESAGVYSRTEDKTIYSRRMVRDKAKSEQAKEWGKGGGNPELVGTDKGRVNPPDKGKDKPQKPYSKNHIPEAADARALDENGLKQKDTLEALFSAICTGRKPPDMAIIPTWLLDGIALGTISAAVSPILKRKADMVSLAYCDAAVRQAHAKTGPSGPVVPYAGQVFIVEGTMEWAAWEHFLRRSGGRGSPVCDEKDEHGRVTGRRGWPRPSAVPEGYDEATGEFHGEANVA